MFDSRSALGFFVHTPCGPRKSGIPDSVEMPAPVKTTTWDAASTQRRASASAEFVWWIVLTARSYSSAGTPEWRSNLGDCRRWRLIPNSSQRGHISTSNCAGMVDCEQQIQEEP